MTTRRVQVLLLVIIAFILGYFIRGFALNVQWAHYKPNITVVNKEPPSDASSVDFNLFWNVWDKLTTNYYDKKAVDPQKLLYGAISGMVNAVGDPYTMFLPPTQQTSFQQQMAGQFQGIGAELSSKDNHVIVVAPLDGSPAQKAGIRAGDMILAVEGKSIDGVALDQVVGKIRGPKDTTVTLTIQHKGDSNASDIKITRGTITVKSVLGWVKQAKDVEGVSLANTAVADKNVMYLRLSQFGDNTNTDWQNLVNSLYGKVQDGTVKGIVLDLRNNPGGYLTDATFIAGEFLPQGTPVVMEQDASGENTTLSVNRDGKLGNTNVPLVVLINKGSASASEIVAGALRDNKRAQLVGDTSFGKGTIQQALDLGAGAGLHVTIGKWLTPNGTWVHGKGLTPDVQVSTDSKDPSHDAQLEKAIQTVLGQ